MVTKCCMARDYCFYNRKLDYGAKKAYIGGISIEDVASKNKFFASDVYSAYSSQKESL
jgi:hypothetical protein